jgi:serine/threonine protein kinase
MPVIKVVVQELGSGQFGSVVEVLDLINKVTKAEKTLKKKSKNIYIVNYIKKGIMMTKRLSTKNLSQRTV